MKLLLAAAALSIGATMSSAAPDQAPAGNRLLNCTARVLHSEELPFAPVGQWLVNLTLEITPPNASAYLATVHERMPWQAAPPRRGQAFRLLCDPARPGDFRLLSRHRL